MLSKALNSNNTSSSSSSSSNIQQQQQTKKPAAVRTRSTSISTTTTTTSSSSTTSSSTTPPTTSQQVSKPFQIPDAFGIVEAGIYRCSLVNPNHFSFLETLDLKTIVFLSQELLEKSLVTYCEKKSIELINMGVSLVQYPQGGSFEDHQSRLINQYAQDESKPLADISTSWKHCSEELVKEALELILNRKTHPILVMCSSGVHTTGTVVGCLRKLQSWSLTSIWNEYETYAHNSSRYVNRQFIELFDVDLVSLPSELPFWFSIQHDLMTQERKYLKENKHAAIKSSQVPQLTKDDNRFAFQEYWFCRDAPLISAKSTYTKQSVIEEEDD
jgi:protein tyrosine/serine phosphatase